LPARTAAIVNWRKSLPPICSVRPWPHPYGAAAARRPKSLPAILCAASPVTGIRPAAQGAALGRLVTCFRSDGDGDRAHTHAAGGHLEPGPPAIAQRFHVLREGRCVGAQHFERRAL